MKLLTTLLIVVSYMVLINFLTSFISKIGRQKSVPPYRIKYITKTLKISITLFFLMLLILSFGIDYAQVSLFLSSIFAVIGVALFAQWSILSNITASMIIFFAFPYRVGDKIRVIEAERDVIGVIEEISLFHVIIKDGDDLITYPNNLILQKAVVKPGQTEKIEKRQE